MSVRSSVSVSLRTASRSWGSRTIRYQRTLAKLPWEPCTLIIRQKHARFGKRPVSARGATDAPSTMMRMTGGVWLTHYQWCPKNYSHRPQEKAISFLAVVGHQQHRPRAKAWSGSRNKSTRSRVSPTSASSVPLLVASHLIKATALWTSRLHLRHHLQQSPPCSVRSQHPERHHNKAYSIVLSTILLDEVATSCDYTKR